jgi:hypothetical protein
MKSVNFVLPFLSISLKKIWCLYILVNSRIILFLLAHISFLIYKKGTVTLYRLKGVGCRSRGYCGRSAEIEIPTIETATFQIPTNSNPATHTGICRSTSNPASLNTNPVHYNLGWFPTWCTKFLFSASSWISTKSVHHRTIQINYHPDATIFQFFILTFIYSSTCFGSFPAHHQELNDCSGNL